MVKVGETLEVPTDSVILVVPSQLGIQLRKEHHLRQSTVLATPILEARQGGTVFLACRSALDHWLSPATASPTKLKTQKLEGAACFPIERTEPDQVRFLRCNLQSELLQPICQHVIKSLGIGLQFEGADEIVRVPTQIRCPLAVLLDGFLKPDVQDIMKIDIGEDG